MSKLLTQALAKFLGGVIAVGALVFLPAGSFGFQQGWIFMGTLFIMLLYVPLIIIRIHHEEKILEANLPGYIEYKQHTKYRLIPLVW